MQPTQLSMLSMLKKGAGVLSTILLVSGYVAAQDNFGFSSLPQQSEASQARIITGENSLRQSSESQFRQTPPLRSLPSPTTYQASEVSPAMTEVYGDVQQTSHASAPMQPAVTRLYQLAHCDWRQFEYNLIQMWISQPKVEMLKEGQIMRVEIPTADPQTRNTMLINREDSTVYFEGADALIPEWNEVMRELDREQRVDDLAVQMISTVGLGPEQMQKVNYMVRMKQQDDETMRAVQLPGGTQAPQDEEIGGPVEARIIPGVGTLLLKGNQQDVDELRKQIEDFMKAAQASLPQPKRFDLKNANPTLAAETIQQLYDNQLAETQGPASITAVQNPNGLLVVGKAAAVKLIEGIIKELDRDPSEQVPGREAEFKVFALLHMSAIDAKQRVDEYFNQSTDPGIQEPGTPENVLTIADPRANLLIVKATPSYLEQIKLFLDELDIADTSATREIRLIKLRNTLATQVAPVIQFAINGGTAFAPSQNQQAQAQQPPTLQNQGGVNTSQAPQTSLQMMTVDREGNQLRSGIVIDVQITADEGSNSLIIRAPADSMPLIEALVERLDVIPEVETQIKVFQILNGEALTLINMLNTLFGGGTQGAQGGAGGAVGGVNGLPLQSVTARDGQSLANLRFTLDERTNSIIASGPVGDLEVVKNLLTRLDEDDVNRRQVTVVRLNNAYAIDVSDAINEWLQARTTLVSDNFQSQFVANKREVIVVPETVSNSLIISALPQYYAEVMDVIANLDRRPPMVKVKVMLAEVNLNALEEFGIEIGVQDSLLFDRGQSLANPLSTATLATGENLAGTARSAFGVGTVSADAGFGGFTLSAGNESVNLLMRSLKSRNCLRVLSRPHLMTIENLQGRITVGSNVPRVTGTTVTNGIAQTNVTPINVGVTLEVTPRVSPDGMIVMFVNAINSQLADVGIVVGTDINGNSIESPIINQTEAQTTVMGRSGQTIVFSGLIQETKSSTNRGIPILSGLPVVGPLFGFESNEATRSELLIIMTPYIVTDDETLRQQNAEEMDRMHWCMCDVTELYGSTGYDGNQSFSTTATYYPDLDPSGMNPVQQGQPNQQFEMQSAPGNPVPGNNVLPPQSSYQPEELGAGIQTAEQPPAKDKRRSLFRFR